MLATKGIHIMAMPRISWLHIGVLSDLCLRLRISMDTPDHSLAPGFGGRYGCSLLVGFKNNQASKISR